MSAGPRSRRSRPSSAVADPGRADGRTFSPQGRFGRRRPGAPTAYLRDRGLPLVSGIDDPLPEPGGAPMSPAKAPAKAPAAPHLTPTERAERGKAARREVPRESHADYESTSQRPDPIDIIGAQSARRWEWDVKRLSKGRRRTGSHRSPAGSAFARARMDSSGSRVCGTVSSHQRPRRPASGCQRSGGGLDVWPGDSLAR